MDGSLGINLHLCIVASACPFVGLARQLTALLVFL
jgi:hypothetical protein